MADVWVFVFSMVDGISLLFLSVYFVSFDAVVMHIMYKYHAKILLTWRTFRQFSVEQQRWLWTS